MQIYGEDKQYIFIPKAKYSKALETSDKQQSYIHINIWLENSQELAKIDLNSRRGKQKGILIITCT